MAIKDEILVGDATIGNFIVGFYDCRSNDGENAEDKILHAYRQMNYRNVRPLFCRGTLDGVIHDGMDFDAPFTDDLDSILSHIDATCGKDLLRRADLIRKHRVNNY